MPWSAYLDYTCPKCGASFRSTHYKCPERCPACRKAHRAERSLMNYHKRSKEGREKSHHKHRDVAYDGGRMGAPESVYSPQCTIHLRRETAACQCCRNVRDLINGYCELCRGCGANEAQCCNARGIA